MELPQENKNETPYDPAIPEGIKAYNRDTCTSMFIVDICNSQLWNQSTYPSTGEWIKKM
jgi:hypothetical protein